MAIKVFHAMVVLALLLAAPAAALNKQGVATADEFTVTEDGQPPAFNASGYVFAGAMVYNPSYAARPDNTGHALGRTGAHLDLDFFGKRAGLTYDVNVFSDRDGANPLRPTEHDHIIGLLARWRSFDAGGHWEADLPADRPGLAQSYVDLFARWSWRLEPPTARIGVQGFFTLAGFVDNQTYAARPDLSGLAMLRLNGHAEIDVLKPWLGVAVDLNVFTDRFAHAGLLPSELDTTVGAVVHVRAFDVSVVAENDRPLDRPGLQQSYVMTLLSYRFDAQRWMVGRRGHGA